MLWENQASSKKFNAPTALMRRYLYRYLESQSGIGLIVWAIEMKNRMPIAILDTDSDSDSDSDPSG